MKNHNLFLLPSFLFLGLLPCSAQYSVDLGFKGGLSIPSLSSGSDSNPINSGYTSRLGADVALFAEFHFTKNFSIQPQVEYSSQGGKKNGNQAFAVPAGLRPFFAEGQVPPYLYADYNSTAKINYLMFPLLGKYRVSMGPHWNFYVAMGPFVSVLVSAENKTSGTSEIYLDEQHTQALPIGAQSFDNTEKIKDELHRCNAGVTGHIGFSYALINNNSIFIEGGGNYGFIPIQKDEANGKNRTGAGVVVVGYQFRICPNMTR
ncbi:Outer membrane protein beta-barrel domain-containing protein [Chryseolinea serpens]|uniref:Outer membrane protein beta-barrel domain-containing protein n=1 Tax=Chryseolinea serpens TaxID=947013 RepID=A0A1M5WS98_9BACT|nr:porin family protein [Chryseolinea serpens]SHH90505.1 Outer membrane protein beta-barrel domain-containing protein [Chryseolinea serpens]